jgi:TonB family C-terminal domain
MTSHSADLHKPRVGKKTLTFRQALIISLLLHGTLCFGGISLERFMDNPARRPPSNTVVFDLFGMISTRQAEARQPGPPSEILSAEVENIPEETPPPETPPEPQTELKVEPLPEKTTPPQASSDQVVVKKPKKKEKPKTENRRRQDDVSGRPGDAQIGQTLKQKQNDERAMTRYLGGLRRAIQTRLRYPNAARKDAMTGSPVIRFTIMENGGILPGTLAIHRSSGHDLLDRSALDAARSSSPLPIPPRQMQIVIAISFAESR